MEEADGAGAGRGLGASKSSEEAGLRVILVGDIGGTHARFALLNADSGVFQTPPATFLCQDHRGLEALVNDYLEGCPQGLRPTEAALAVAGPVSGGEASLTNLPWSISETALLRAGFARAIVINDFEALALAAPGLTSADKAILGGGATLQRAGAIAVLGPGTGFGVAALCRDARGSAVLVTEGGHMGFSPSDEVEVQVWRLLARRFGRVSLERILSGQGLLNLHAALCEIEGGGSDHASPADLLAAAQAGDTAASATMQRFCSILGGAAGDFALAYGAIGGVLLAGGIAPRLVDVLQSGGFRRAFERKGRFEGYLASIPTELILKPFVALTGAAEALRLRS